MEFPIYDEPILWFALRYLRPDMDPIIWDMCEKIIQLSPPWAKTLYDSFGNLWIDTRRNDESTMFQAHLDTAGATFGYHDIFVDEDGLIYTDGQSLLGADDGAGCAMIASLMGGGIPALYLFTQGEERGGLGGRYAATSMAYMVKGIQRCIAFDRRGNQEICGAQFVGTLASHDFVNELSLHLGMGHVWGRGTYTDNSEWMDIIPEIVNISVGYQCEHTVYEYLDYPYFCDLRKSALILDWESLPTVGPQIPSIRDIDLEWDPSFRELLELGTRGSSVKGIVTPWDNYDERGCVYLCEGCGCENGPLEVVHVNREWIFLCRECQESVRGPQEDITCDHVERGAP